MNVAIQPTTARSRDADPALLARPFIACLALALLTLVIYWPVRSFEYLSLDDTTYITGNPYLHAGVSLKGLLWALGTSYAAMWHPVTWLTYLLDADLFGLDPSGPHIVNLLWHIGNAVVLFLLLREATSAHWRSLFVAALFALHPLHTESVAWLSERKDVVSTFFMFLALWAYCRYVGRSEGRGARAQGNPSSESRSQGPAVSPIASSGIQHPASSIQERARDIYYWLSVVFFALALMSKPMVVTLPFLMLLLDYWPLERFRDSTSRLPEFWRLVREKVPFFVLSIPVCVVTFWAERKGGAVQSLTDLSLGLRVENTFVAYARYLGKTLWPTHLAVPYPHVPRWPLWLVILGACLLFGLSALAVRLGRKLPFVATGWFWFAGMLVPVIGLVQVGEHSLADRYTYVPLVGLFIILAWGAHAVFARLRIPGLAAGLSAAVLIGACAAVSCEQLHHWQNSQTLFTHSIKVTKDNWLAYFARGCDLADKNRPAEAIQDYQRALEINPKSDEAFNNMGNAFLRLGETNRAIECLSVAVRLKPDRCEYHSNLGAALDKSGQPGEALKQYREALRCSPNDALTHFRFGNTLAALGQLDEAIQQYQRAVADRPDYSQAMNNLGIALFKEGKLDEAVEQFRDVLRQDPGHAGTYCNLANALAAQYKWPEAVEQYGQALRLMPDSIDAHYGLALALVRLGQNAQAASEFQEVLRLKPTHAGAQKQLRALSEPEHK